MPHGGDAGPVILLRTHVFGEREQAYAEALGGPGRTVAIACDETRAPLDTGRFAKVSITRPACRALGLYAPPDFTWRNGDYAFYLARQRFPQARHFWMIEPDVEHSFADFGAFLARYESVSDVDLLTSYLRPADADWYWRTAVRDGAVGAHRCFFPLIRMSARAIDVCLQARRRSRFSLRDRLHWANDEVFVATTVMRAGLKAMDLNGAGSRVYDENTFRYDPLNGEDGSFRRVAGRVFHPVLYGDAYAAKLARLAADRDSALKRARRKLQRMLRAFP